jgi:KilA-N domain
MNIIKQWNSKTIRFRQSDNYGSLTDMAQATSKRVNDWLRLKSTNEYLQSLNTVTGIPVTDIVDVIQGGIPEEQGTWAERKVCLRFAQWCNSDLAVQVDIWLEELLTKGFVSIQPMSPTQAIIQALQLWEKVQEEQQRQAVELAVTKALALSTDAKVTALEADMVTLKAAIAQPIPTCNQTARQRIVELAQLMANVLIQKGHFASFSDAIRDVWNRINLKIRNSHLKLDLSARKANNIKQFEKDYQTWESTGKPKGLKPNKQNYAITLPAVIETLSIEQPALECTVTVAQELVLA